MIRKGISKKNKCSKTSSNHVNRVSIKAHTSSPIVSSHKEHRFRKSIAQNALNPYYELFDRENSDIDIAVDGLTYHLKKKDNIKVIY